MSQSELLFLDTDHAEIIDNTPSDTIFTLNFNSGNNMSNYGISLEALQVPNIVYPINVNNNKIYFSENGGATLTATITENNYNGTTLASEIETQLNAVGTFGTYSVSYDDQSKKLTIGGLTLPDTITLTTGDNSMERELGMSFPKTGTAITSDYPINISGTQYIDIQADVISRNYSSNGKTNILERIPIPSAFGGIVNYQNTTDDFIKLSEESINTLEIRITDDRGKLWVLPPTAQVSMTLKLTRFV
jgi:hypothetical protein